MAIGSSDTARKVPLPRMIAGNALYALIAANVAVFAGVAVCALFGASGVAAALALPSDAALLVQRPWTPLTYMFVHTDAMHLVFNMLWLYCFGAVMQRSGANGRRLVGVYAGGGIAGAAVFLSACALAPSLGPSSLIGASAAVLAVAVAAAFEAPDMQLRLWLIGDVRLKWIVAAMVVLFCIGFTGGPAATAAHAGGAAYGAMAHWMRALVRRMRRTASKPTPADMRAELDALLDKVKLSGYDALSRRDKQRLFELSHKVKP